MCSPEYANIHKSHSEYHTDVWTCSWLSMHLNWIRWNNLTMAHIQRQLSNWLRWHLIQHWHEYLSLFRKWIYHIFMSKKLGHIKRAEAVHSFEQLSFWMHGLTVKWMMYLKRKETNLSDDKQSVLRIIYRIYIYMNVQ